MEKEKIFVTISGKSGSGRSRVTYMLKEFFKERGLNARLDLSENLDYKSEADFDRFMGYKNKEIIDNLSESREIIIQEKQLPRNSL